jgi:hypothetical protein
MSVGVCLFVFGCWFDLVPLPWLCTPWPTCAAALSLAGDISNGVWVLIVFARERPEGKGVTRVSDPGKTKAAKGKSFETVSTGKQLEKLRGRGYSKRDHHKKYTADSVL